MARFGIVVSLASPLPSSRKRNSLFKKLPLPLVLLLGTVGAFAQSPQDGMLPQTPMHKDVNLFDLSVNLSVPLVSKSGIGQGFFLGMTYNNNSFVLNGVNGTSWWELIGNWPVGWIYTTIAGFLHSWEDDTCPYGINNPIYPTIYTGYTDPAGGSHEFATPIYIETNGETHGTCHGHTMHDHYSYLILDDSGLTANMYSSGSPKSLSTRNGTVITAGSPSTSVDLYNNTISGPDPTGHFTDTVGVNEATLTYQGLWSTGTYTYPTTSGPNTATITITYVKKTQQTNFGCSGISEWTQSNVPFIDHITFGDGSTESFTYESQVANTVTGRIASVTYPDGSVVSYRYGSMRCNVVVNGDAGPTSLTRTDNMGSTTYTWNSATQTTVVGPSPASNKSVYTFIGSFPHEWVSQIQEYQGSSTLLRTNALCYNGNQSSCPTAVPPTQLTQEDKYVLYAGMSGSSRNTVKYDNYGNVTESDAYDFGASSPAFKTVFSGYGQSWNGSSCVTVGNGVNGVPCTVEKYDINNNPIGYSTFNYNSKGSLLSKSTWVAGSISGGRYLASSYSYNNNGTMYQSFEANNKATTNTFGDCNSGGLTKVTSPISTVYSQATHDSGCYGFVVTSVTPPDGNTAYAAYSDPLWRVTSTTDAAGYTTTFPYTVPDNTSESVLTFGSTTIDEYSQSNVTANPPTVFKQIEDGSNWGTVVSGAYWDTYGVTSFSEMPCSSTTKGTGCTGATSTVTHDALGRPLVATDGGGGTLTNAYTLSGNVVDITTTRGPAPAGEVIKKVQKEYNGLGQLLSTCWLSSASGTVSCGQAAGGTGYLQTYSYNTNGTLASVTRGSQTHSSTYDVAGRVLSSTFPESGTTQFFYDSAPSTPGVSCSTISGLSGVTNATPLGHLLKTYDANGTTTCLAYDANGRNVAIAYAGTTFDGNNKYFVWDSAIVNGVTMTGATSHLAEAYTAPTAGGTKVTDEGFSYDSLGHVSGVYQSSTHSGGYYHTSATYFNNGALKTLSGIPGQSTLTYSIDEKGRPYSTVQGSTNLVGSVTYDSSDQPLVVTMGLGDKDTYTYQSTTGRMSSYAFSIGATPVASTGTLTWNANGTLNALAIVDGINSGGTQTCTYGTSTDPGYDEIGRLIEVDCGAAIWQQDFSYDAFDNLTKSVPSGGTGINWQPGYNQTNNHYTLGGTSYDSNGNLLTDTFHTYTWNQVNKMKMITDAGVTPVYDAFDNLVEKNSNGVYTEFLYSPVGRLARMTGQTLSEALLPLPGGLKMVEGNGNYFWHQDWLGSTRFVSSRPSRTSIEDRAYAPYGEMYNLIGGNSEGISFTGDLQDMLPASGSTQSLFDTPNRELHPTQGRWTSPDPAHASWNAYRYSTNPMGEIDPGVSNDRPCDSAGCGWGTFNTRHIAMGDGGCFSLDGGSACAQLIGDLALRPTGTVATGWTLQVVTPDGEIVTGSAAKYDIWDGYYTSQTEIQTYAYVYGNLGLLSMLGNTPTPTMQPRNPANKFTLGLRQPGQTFNQCMQANAGNYSLLGVADFATGANGQIADNVWLGFTPASNLITSIYNAAAGSLTSLLQTGPTVVTAGMGTVLTSGRRTSSIMSLNLPGTPGGSAGGAPALGSAPSNAARAGKAAALALKIAIDAGFFLAEGAGCAGPMNY